MTELAALSVLINGDSSGLKAAITSSVGLVHNVVAWLHTTSKLYERLCLSSILAYISTRREEDMPNEPHDVTLTPAVDRIIASLAHVMTDARARGRDVSQYDLVKTLFLADRAHLNAWGRPITYDNYCAMKHGPVPSLAYDLLKGNEKSLKDHKIQSLPWSATEAGNGVRHYSPVEGAQDHQDALSESDVEALNDALTTVLQLGFSQIRRLTHEDPAYVEAWRDDGDRAAYNMKLGLMFEEPDFDRAATIAEYSPYV